MTFKDVLKKATLVVTLASALVAASIVGRKMISFDDLPPKAQKEVKDDSQVLLDTIKDLRTDFAKLVPSQMTRQQYFEIQIKLEHARSLLLIMKETPTTIKLQQQVDYLKKELSIALSLTRNY